VAAYSGEGDWVIRRDRVEIVTANNRKGFAYTLPKKDAEQEKAENATPGALPAAVAKALDAAGIAAPESAAQPAESPAPTKPDRKKPGPKPKAKADPVAKALDQVEAALKISPAPAPAADPQPQTAEAKPGADATKLADAIIARLKRELAPMPSELDAISGGATIHVHIEQIDIHLGGL
jgi:predicted Zn-dependent protease